MCFNVVILLQTVDAHAIDLLETRVTLSLGLSKELFQPLEEQAVGILRKFLDTLHSDYNISSGKIYHDDMEATLFFIN